MWFDMEETLPWVAYFHSTIMPFFQNFDVISQYFLLPTQPPSFVRAAQNISICARRQVSLGTVIKHQVPNLKRLRAGCGYMTIYKNF